MKRLATGLVGAAVLLAAIFLLPSWAFFWLAAAILTLAATELVRLGGHWAPGAPLWLLAVAVPVTAAAVSLALPAAPDPPWSRLAVVALAAALPLLLAVAVLLGRTPASEAFLAIGVLSFALPYLALPLVSVHALHALDRWLLILLLALVWAGDTAAYYAGSRLGRRKLAPRVSPNKTWEGAVAGFLASAAVAGIWSLWLLARLEPAVLLLGAVCAVAGQLGDLVESMMKRAAGVKDSGRLLPGHGGILDRIDALLFAAPCFLLGVLLIGPESFLP